MTETDNTRSADEATTTRRRNLLHRLLRHLPLIAPVLLWAVPYGVLFHTGQHWPVPVTSAGTAVFALGLIGMPLAMARGHGRRQQDRAAIAGDTLLGVSWVLFTWSVLLGVLLRPALAVAGVGDGQERAASPPGPSSARPPPSSPGAMPRPAASRGCAGSTCTWTVWGRGWTAHGSPSSPTRTTARSTAPAGRRVCARR